DLDFDGSINPSRSNCSDHSAGASRKAATWRGGHALSRHSAREAVCPLSGAIRPVTPFMIIEDASCSRSILLDRLLFLGARADLVRVQAAGKIQGGERARRYRAITDRKPHLATGLVVKIRVRGQERLGFDGRCIGEAIDIMVAISLSVGEAVEG